MLIPKLLVAAVLVSCACAIAQTPAQQNPSQPAPPPPPGATVLRTGVQLVVVDAVVRDKSGNVVHGLTKDDFIVKEANAPQTVRHFEEFTSNPTRPMTLPQMPKLPAGEFTNYTPIPSGGPLVVLLIDTLNTPVSDQDYLHKQLDNFIEHAPTGSRIAIVGFGAKLTLLQGFTSDPNVLRSAIAGVKATRKSPLLNEGGASDATIADSATDPFTSGSAGSGGSVLATSNLQDFMAQVGVMQTALRTQYSIEQLIVLAHWLENFPGRKNVLWYSGSFPLGVIPNASFQNQTDVQSEDGDLFRSMVNLMTQARIAIYPIDARGLQGSASFQASNSPVAGFGGPAVTGALSAEGAQRASDHSTMQAIADDTGGKALYNRNDLVKATNDAINEGANYYTLAYTPSEHKTGGEWRPIKLELSPADKFKGYTLEYRRGYYAENLKVPAHKTGEATVAAANYTPAATARNYALLSMAHGAPALTDILFTARVLPHNTVDEDTPANGNVLDPKTPMQPPFRSLDVDVLAPPKYFTLTQDAEGKYRGAIELAVKLYSQDGKLLNVAVKKLTLDFTPETYAHFKQNNVGMHLEVSVPAQKDAFLRIGFQDVFSGKVGTMELETAPLLTLSPVN